MHARTVPELARHSIPVLTAPYTHSIKGDDLGRPRRLPIYRKVYKINSEQPARKREPLTMTVGALADMLGVRKRDAGWVR